MIIQNLILILTVLIWTLICVCVGFFVGLRIKPNEKPKTQPEPPTEEQLRAAEKMKHEYMNFLSYSGTEQKDFNA